MADARFYEIPLTGSGVRGRTRVTLQRMLRKLLLPIFQRQAEYLEAIIDRLEAIDRENLASRADWNDAALRAEASAGTREEALNHKIAMLSHQLEEMRDSVKTRLDEIPPLTDQVRAEVASMKRQGETTREELASVVALQWDHVALARRLAQLEDRLIAPAPDVDAAVDHEPESAILFPGLERYARPQAG